tara:strand:+ start:798 stop:983 length:186 start_codon:yes stop_codon:yes gene_type:complete
MIAELILIRKLLEKTPLGSTPSRGVLPKSFVKPFKKKQRQRPKIITPTKQVGPAIGLKKYF